MKTTFLSCEPVQDLDELSKRMELVAALGYDGIELTAKSPFDYSMDDVAALSDRFRLPVVSLLTGWS